MSQGKMQFLCLKNMIMPAAEEGEHGEGAARARSLYHGAAGAEKGEAGKRHVHKTSAKFSGFLI